MLCVYGNEGSASHPGRSLPPGKARYPLYGKLGGPQGRAGQVRKISPPTRIQFPDSPARKPVSIPTELPGPQIVRKNKHIAANTKNVCYILKGAGIAQSVLRLATGLDGPGFESRCGARFFAPVQTGSGAHPASCTRGTGSFPGVKRSGRGVDHPLPSSAEVKERV